MAAYLREDAKIEHVYIRRRLPGGEDIYERQPYNLVTYDDAMGGFIEPVSQPVLSEMTWRDAESIDVKPRMLIVDSPPYDELWEMH